MLPPKPDFIPSGSEGESGGEAFHQRARDLDHVGLCVRRLEKGDFARQSEPASLATMIDKRESRRILAPPKEDAR
jgi:hypothetical protein